MANLRQADLRGANLSRANLAGADLSYADFRSTNVTADQLGTAILIETILPDSLQYLRQIGAAHPARVRTRDSSTIELDKDPAHTKSTGSAASRTMVKNLAIVRAMAVAITMGTVQANANEAAVSTSVLGASVVRATYVIDNESDSTLEVRAIVNGQWIALEVGEGTTTIDAGEGDVAVVVSGTDSSSFSCRVDVDGRTGDVVASVEGFALCQ